MPDNNLVKVIVINKNIELPVPMNDNFQVGKPKVEFAPTATISKQLADKLIGTYPDTYAIFDSKVHKDSKEGYKIANNYRKPEFENIFGQLNPDQRDLVLQFMASVKAGNYDKPKTVAPEAPKTVAPEKPKS